jgi:uncharacterized C2H2 Zn-finger protein
MHLRKSGTFSSPKSLSNDVCGLENQRFMPRRSPTSTESLEELIEDSSVRRVANLLKNFDQTIAGAKAASASGSSILNDPEVLPVPSFMLTSTTLESMCMEIDPKPASPAERNQHDHASDSGLGSSIDESKAGKKNSQLSVVDAQRSNTLLKGDARTSHSITTSVSSTHSAITRSFSALGASEEKHTLGEYACKQIHDTIVKPILAEESLKEFHPLIQDVPRRIGEKNICNLRDLEKTLIFLAPVSGIRYLSESAKAYCILRGLKEFSATPTSYLRFCERSIQLLHTTVDYLSEQDQRLPTDRPYTNNYFLDLIEQIRRYAAIMAATRQKETNDEQLDEMDYQRYDDAATYLFPRLTNCSNISGEKISLRGGLSHNGRPMELVREKDGKVTSLAENAAYKSPSKRNLSDDEMDDDEVMRSMARRRKSEKPGDVLHMCRDCKKEFKRPCDLTKHEKTHSRPWKCSEKKCKYFELGWPTEKERDRHMNDKHSAAPAQYKCLYPPCTYASKRESNCKQHMEKAHGWEYVRSKSNGKKPRSVGAGHSPATPLTPFLGTPQSAALATPMTPFNPSPSMPLMDNFDLYSFGTPSLSVQGFQDGFRRDSMTTNGSHLTYSSGPSPVEMNSFMDAVSPQEAIVNHNDMFGNCGFDSNFNTGFQQPTPALSTNFDFESLPFTNNSNLSAGLPQLSPMAQPDVTLFSPPMHADEGFGDAMDMDTFSRPTEDFTLFDTAQPSHMPLNNTSNFFPDFNQLGGQFENGAPFDDFYPSTTLDDLLGADLGAPQ